MYFLLLLISDSALLPLSATGGGRKATPSSPLFGKKICKIKNQYINCTDFMERMTGLEPATSTFVRQMLSQLSYAPTCLCRSIEVLLNFEYLSATDIIILQLVPNVNTFLKFFSFLRVTSRTFATRPLKIFILCFFSLQSAFQGHPL